MELISYSEFSQLRLKRFCKPRTEIEDLGTEGEYMGCLWGGEGVKGVDFLWPKNRPKELACILLTLQAGFCPDYLEQAILEALQLPVRKGMPSQRVRQMIGQPVKEGSGDTWETLTFRFGVAFPYLILADFGRNGLRGLDVCRIDLLPKDALS